MFREPGLSLVSRCTWTQTHDKGSFLLSQWYETVPAAAAANAFAARLYKYSINSELSVEQHSPFMCD